MEKAKEKQNEILREKLNEYRRKLEEEKKIALAVKDTSINKKIPDTEVKIPKGIKEEEPEEDFPEDEEAEEEEEEEFEDEEDEEEEDEEETIDLPDDEEIKPEVKPKQKPKLEKKETKENFNSAEKEDIAKMIRFEMNELAVDNGLFRYSLLESLSNIGAELKRLNDSFSK